MLAFYFGLTDRAGNTDQRFSDSLTGIVSSVDDCIFFSRLLCDELSKHGKKIKGRLGRGAPKVNEPQWEKAERDNLMSDEGSYEDWTTMFVDHEKETWWRRLFN